MSRRFVWIASVVVGSWLSGTVAAQPPQPLPKPMPAPPAPPAAESAAAPALSYLELARAYRSAQRLHHYRYVAYPEHVRRLDKAIDLAQAEADVLAARRRHYRQVESFGSGSPVYTAAQDTRLAELAVNEHLRQLQRERDRFSRRRRSQILSLQLEHLELLEQLRQR